MSAPKLSIVKSMQHIQGKTRPCCHIKAHIGADVQKGLDEHFANEALFKRASYSSMWPEGALAIPAALAPHLSAFLKNDACPEITVKTITAGQLFQAGSIWEMLCFEFVAKLAFENFVALAVASVELGGQVDYYSAAMGGPDDAALDAAVVELRATAGEMAAA